MGIFYSKIVALGDSHVGNFSDICNILTFGPETLYRIGNGSIKSHIEYFTQNKQLIKDYLWIYCFGEIDVRCHIHKQVTVYNRDIDEIISTLVDKYFDFILSTNANIAVCGVVPTAKITGQEHKLMDTINSKYPFVGSDYDRKIYTQKLNGYIMHKCLKENKIYIDMYADYHMDGFLNPDLAGDLIHVSNKKYIADRVSSIEHIINYI